MIPFLCHAETFFPEEMNRLIDQLRMPCAWTKMKTSGQETFQVLSLSTGVGTSHSLSVTDVPVHTSSGPIERSRGPRVFE